VLVVAVAQAFKETLPLGVVASALGGGIRSAGAEPGVFLASDGGDGLMDALEERFARRTAHRVTGPLGQRLQVEVGWLESKTAVIESRLVCGLGLVPPGKRDPSSTTTRGVGELIAELETQGAQRIYVGLGGSATMDGGVGMARAWGWVPLGEQGEELPEGGGALADLSGFRPGARPAASIIGLADVRNPLTGPTGARVYARQKGASPAQEERLAGSLERLAGIVDPAGELSRRAGAGAAGGLGFGITFFAGGTLEPGAPWVLERTGFFAALPRAALVLCAEGAFDATSLEGKLTGVVIAAARHAGVPAGLLAPRAEKVPDDVLLETGGGRWSAEDLSRHTKLLVCRALRSASDA
jgi:glycerate kinase